MPQGTAGIMPRAQRGGCGTIPAQGGAKPLSFIYLIPLWLCPVNRPVRAERGGKAVPRAPPPKQGGHVTFCSGTL